VVESLESLDPRLITVLDPRVITLPLDSGAKTGVTG
jgi:hypothetical protein